MRRPSKIFPLSYFFLGFLAYAGLGFSLVRFPWVRHHAPSFAAAALALAALFYLLFRRERRRELVQPRGLSKLLGLRLAFLFTGLALAWAAVLGLGRFRYHQAQKAVEASQLRPAWPENDENIVTRRNGWILLKELSESKAFKQSCADRGKVEGLSSLAAKVIRGDIEAEKKLRKRRKELRGYLKVLTLAREAPAFSFNVRYDVPLHKVEIPSLIGLLNLVRLACAEAVLAVGDGDTFEAESGLIQARWLSTQTLKGPLLIPVMVATGQESMIYEAALPLFRRGLGARLMKGVEEGALEKAYRNALRTELLYGPGAARDMVGAHDAPFSFSLGWAMVPWLDWDFAAGLGSSLEISRCADLKPIDARACMEAVSGRIEKDGWTFQSIALPKFGPMHAKAAGVTARQRMATLALAAGQFKKRSGKWPASAGLLGKAGQALDPFTGRPLAYRLKSGRPEILSLGCDAKEDAAKQERAEDADILFRL